MNLPKAASAEAVAAAARIADEVLFPRVGETDASDLVARESLDTLAAAGLYGVFGPRRAGGLELSQENGLAVVEELARGCLATAFVWLQHHSAVRAVADAGGSIEASLLEPLCQGALRAGVAFAGLRRPGPATLRARPQGDGYVFDGQIPWLTGWGLVDLVLVAARDVSRPEEDVVWVLVEGEEGPGFGVERLRLATMDATSTVTAEMRSFRVPAERVVAVEPFKDWSARDAAGLRTNGSMALGHARRAIGLLEEAGSPQVASSLGRDVGSARAGLDAAEAKELPAARAVAVEVACRAAAALVVSKGGRAIAKGRIEELLARQATFLLVFGQTAAIKYEQLRRLAP